MSNSVFNTNDIQTRATRRQTMTRLCLALYSIVKYPCHKHVHMNKFLILAVIIFKAMSLRANNLHYLDDLSVTEL